VLPRSWFVNRTAVTISWTFDRTRGAGFADTPGPPSVFGPLRSPIALPRPHHNTIRAVSSAINSPTGISEE
jgi:hypothetical protein